MIIFVQTTVSSCNHYPHKSGLFQVQSTLYSDTRRLRSLFSVILLWCSMHTISISTRNTVKEKKGTPVRLKYKNICGLVFWRIHRRTSRAWTTYSPDVVRICDIPLSQCSIQPFQLPRYKSSVRQPQLDNKRDLDRRPHDPTVVLWWKHHWHGRFRQSTSFHNPFHISTRR